MDKLPRALLIPASSLKFGDKIGEGAFGVVYKGKLKGTSVAIKAYHELVGSRDGGMKRDSPDYARAVSDFIAEATMLSSLHHDKILGFRGVCLDAATRDPRYLVVELAELNLRTYLDKLGRPVTLTELQRFGCDALDAISYLHAYSILHRDLKPEKFLVFVVHGVEVLKLADVGMACFAGENEAVPKSPATTVASTPFYAAPDVGTEFREYEPRDDVYSFGIMMVEIVAKHVMVPPVDWECSVDNRDAIVDAAVRHLRKYVPSFADLIQSCCAHAVDERPTAEDALDTLRGLNCAVVTAMATPQQPAIDIGDLVSAMDAYGLQAGIVDDIVDTVEAKPDMTLTQLVELLRAKKVSTANAHRIKAKLEAASKASMAALDLPLVKSDSDLFSTPAAPLSIRSSLSEELGASPLTLIPSAKLKRLGRLGSGSFGEVFKAKYSDAIVAVKQSGVVCLDRASIDRERRLLGSIPPHPNVVRVLGVCEDSIDNHLLIVMEYCAGGSLLSYLTLLPKPYSAALATNILTQCATGIAHLHSCGVIHRDIRCSNMLVASKDPLRVVVADFGLSHILRGCDGLSTSATMLGPIAWRAPETFEDGDLQVVSTKTDVFMFGCFILEVLTVASPWWWIRKSESLLRVRLKSPINPLDDAITGGKFNLAVRNEASDGSAAIVQALIGLIRRCLEHDPANRPTIAAIIHTLDVIAGRDGDGEIDGPFDGSKSIVSKYDEEVALHPLKMAVVNTASTSLGSFGEVDDAEAHSPSPCESEDDCM